MPSGTRLPPRTRFPHLEFDSDPKLCTEADGKPECFVDILKACRFHPLVVRSAAVSSLELRSDAFAPFKRSSCTTEVLPCSAAMWSAVRPVLSLVTFHCNLGDIRRSYTQINFSSKSSFHCISFHTPNTKYFSKYFMKIILAISCAPMPIERLISFSICSLTNPSAGARSSKERISRRFAEAATSIAWIQVLEILVFIDGYIIRSSTSDIEFCLHAWARAVEFVGPLVRRNLPFASLNLS